MLVGQFCISNTYSQSIPKKIQAGSCWQWTQSALEPVAENDISPPKYWRLQPVVQSSENHEFEAIAHQSLAAISRLNQGSHRFKCLIAVPFSEPPLLAQSFRDRWIAEQIERFFRPARVFRYILSLRRMDTAAAMGGQEISPTRLCCWRPIMLPSRIRPRPNRLHSGPFPLKLNASRQNTMTRLGTPSGQARVWAKRPYIAGSY